jgi:hypothetical protein
MHAPFVPNAIIEQHFHPRSHKVQVLFLVIIRTTSCHRTPSSTAVCDIT